MAQSRRQVVPIVGVAHPSVTDADKAPERTGDGAWYYSVRKEERPVADARVPLGRERGRAGAVDREFRRAQPSVAPAASIRELEEAGGGWTTRMEDGGRTRTAWAWANDRTGYQD